MAEDKIAGSNERQIGERSRINQGSDLEEREGRGRRSASIDKSKVGSKGSQI